MTLDITKELTVHHIISYPPSKEEGVRKLSLFIFISRSYRDSNSSATTGEDDHGGVNQKDCGGGDDGGQSRVKY
jgi:hypothetical protein